MKKISGVYKIINAVTGDFYIGSSKDVKRRWACHKCESTWKQHQNNPMYLDMKRYGLDSFDFQVIAEVEVDKLKETEQQFIEKLKPTYNDRNANGCDIERYKEWQKEYQKSDRCKESVKRRESQREYQNKYYNQLCSYNGETLTLNTLSARFRKSGIAHPTKEAKKYIIKEPIEFYDIYP